MGFEPVQPHILESVYVAVLVLLLAADHRPSAVHTDAPQTVSALVSLTRDMHERGTVVYPRARQTLYAARHGTVPPLASGRRGGVPVPRSATD